MPSGTLNQENEPLTTIRPVTSAYTFAIGSSELADTYLTPIIYRGWSTQFQYSRLQAMAFNPERWVMDLTFGARLSRGNNPGRNANIWHINLKASWAMMHRWQLPVRITLALGGYTAIDAGALYLARNGNNPATAKAAWNVGVKAYATYPFKIGCVKMMARWQGELPVAGVFFAPQYGELYYEIYLGNRNGLVHPSWWSNYFGIDNDVTIDINCGTNWLRVGYRSNVLSTHINHTTTRIVSNQFVIGFVGEWTWMRHASRVSPNTRIISALY